jgi:alkylation response protein AidB-like acyl-CoA dehydrogenase
MGQAPRALAGVLAAIERAAPVIRAEAEPSERAGRATPALVEALLAERLFRLWLPPDLGGDELSLPGSLTAFEAAAYHDGAAGWLVMIGTGGNIFAAYLEEEGAAEIFGPPESVIAGSGTPSGRARLRPGGYFASGRWSYASGAHYATWFTANCVLAGDAGPLAGPDGAPRIRAMAFPAGAVEIIERWEVFGMRGTGSHDFEVSLAIVPERHSFSVFTDAPRLPGPLYRFPFGSIAECSFAAVALGLGRGAIDEFRLLAAVKNAYGSDRPIDSHPGVAARLADAQLLVASSRTWLHQVVGAAWKSASAGQPLSQEEQALVTRASIYATQSAARAADVLFQVAATGPVRMDSTFGRCWRDVHVVRQHAMLSSLRLAPATPGR